MKHLINPQHVRSGRRIESGRKDDARISALESKVHELEGLVSNLEAFIESIDSRLKAREAPKKRGRPSKKPQVDPFDPMKARM